MSANDPLVGLVTRVEADARALAASLQAASEAGIGPAVVLPALLTVFKEAGMMPGSFSELAQAAPLFDAFAGGQS